MSLLLSGIELAANSSTSYGQDRYSEVGRWSQDIVEAVFVGTCLYLAREFRRQIKIPRVEEESARQAAEHTEDIAQANITGEGAKILSIMDRIKQNPPHEEGTTAGQQYKSI